MNDIDKHEIYFDPKYKIYVMPTQICEKCNRLIRDRGFLINNWSKSKNIGSESKLFCDKCFTKHDLDMLYDATQKYMVKVVVKKPEEAYRVFNTPPELGSGRFKDVFQAAQKTQGEKVIDETRYSFRNQNAPDAISLDERDLLLSDRDDFYNKGLSPSDSLAYLKDLQGGLDRIENKETKRLKK